MCDICLLLLFQVLLGNDKYLWNCIQNACMELTDLHAKVRYFCPIVTDIMSTKFFKTLRDQLL
jgi:hypothetical protein